MYTQHLDHLRLCQLDPEQHEHTCGYWYTVTSGSMAHTAFRTEAAFLLWLNERGLKLTAPLAPRGTFAYQPLEGKYDIVSYMNRSAFDAIVSMFETRKCDNGRYTLAKVTEDNGVRTIHHLNCNLPRVEYDYRESDDIYSGAWS